MSEGFECSVDVDNVMGDFRYAFIDFEAILFIANATVDVLGWQEWLTICDQLLSLLSCNFDHHNFGSSLIFFFQFSIIKGLQSILFINYDKVIYSVVK